MGDFNSRKIRSNLEEIAGQLRQARENRNIDINEAARQTGVRADYLAALEKAETALLPAGLYGRNYLKEYAIFLGLDHGPLLESYDQEVQQRSVDPRSLFVKKANSLKFSLTIPKFAKFITISLIIAACFLYLAFYLRNLSAAPYLEISHPAGDISTSSATVTISGQTEPETKVLINNENVLIDSQGYFSLEINLRKGLNSIIISSQKRYGRSAEAARKILME